MLATQARIDAAAHRFRAFFDELSTAFIEREDVLKQVATALLAREHVLLTGPPGTAKSGLANAVFGRIVCEDSGAPSLYSRQITESTVQTDLIGPIDFKNLMETGRTSHFTDEGMLGAAHAFLDEVFDGRDMLLRSALNVLQERELKEGTTVTRGRIEVALMTSNRYIADVLDNARETLLAFVDRIAFIGFVPRSFADPSNLDVVLRRHVAQSSRLQLDALLTIQDVDVLQALAESVVVSEPICEALAKLLTQLDEELNAAVRADPTFVPTRYLSTRTAVRSGQILRALVVHDRIFRKPDREMQALRRDLQMLRLHLLLSGPAPEQVEALLERETDAEERRQLEIVRTEREIFDRCLARLPKVKVEPLEKVRAAAAEPARPQGDKDEPKRAPEPSDPLTPIRQAIDSGNVERIVGAMRELTQLGPEHASSPEQQQRLMGRGVDAIQRVAFRAALDTAADRNESLIGGVRSLAELASSLEDHKVSTHATTKWLRRRARHVINQAVINGLGTHADDLAAATSPTTPTDKSIERMRRRLDLLDELDALRKTMTGAETPGEHVDDDWRRALTEAEDDLADLWDAAFCNKVQRVLAAQRGAPLAQVLAALEPELEWLHEIETRLTSLSGSASQVKAKAVGPRLGDLVASLMQRLEVRDRAALHNEIEAVLAQLKQAKLEHAIAAADWMRWAAEALIRSEEENPTAVESPWTYDGYRKLREHEMRVPVVLAVCEVALRVAPQLSVGGDREPAFSDLVRQLPSDVQASIARIDLARIERAMTYLESWWQALTAGDLPVAERLDVVVKSRFFDVLWDEGALTRFTLEAQLVGEVLEAHASDTQALAARMEALRDQTRRAAHALLRERTQEAWRAAVGP